MGQAERSAGNNGGQPGFWFVFFKFLLFVVAAGSMKEKNQTYGRRAMYVFSSLVGGRTKENRLWKQGKTQTHMCSTDRLSIVSFAGFQYFKCPSTSTEYRSSNLRERRSCFMRWRNWLWMCPHRIATLLELPQRTRDENNLFWLICHWWIDDVESVCFFFNYPTATSSTPKNFKTPFFFCIC